MRVHPFYWTVQTYPSMTAPGKTTAFQEALLVMTNYNQLNTLSSKFTFRAPSPSQFLLLKFQL